MMFSGILLKGKAPVRILAIAGMLALVLVNFLELQGTRFFDIPVAGLMSYDRPPLVFIGIASVSTLLYLLLSARDIEKVGMYNSEYFALLFFIMCGIDLVASYDSLLILFLGIEIISIPLYILTGSDKRNLKSNEASLKYFLMGSFSTGLMLMGIALVYGAKASFGLSAINSLADGKTSVLLIAGMLLLMFSMAFKASVAPFHFWTPDVYDGAPTVFTSFMATVVKAAVFVAFVRLFSNAFANVQSQWQVIAGILTVATLFIGNITAVFQQSVKRMLAYSSIAQAGFMMFAVYSMSAEGKEGLVLYVTAYSLATIGIFAVLIRMQDYTFDGFNGFAKKQPVLAATTTVFLLSLAGIPLTAGFMAKFYMLKATLAGGEHLWLVIFAVLMAAISVYYYFRVIQAMYFRESQTDAPELTISASFKRILVILAVLVILLGIFPDILLSWYYF